MYEIKFTYVDKCLNLSAKVNHKIIKIQTHFVYRKFKSKDPRSTSRYTQRTCDPGQVIRSVTYNKRAAKGTLRFQEAPSFLSYARVQSVMHAWTFFLRYCQHVNILMITTICPQIKLFYIVWTDYERGQILIISKWHCLCFLVYIMHKVRKWYQKLSMHNWVPEVVTTYFFPFIR